MVEGKDKFLSIEGIFAKILPLKVQFIYTRKEVFNVKEWIAYLGEIILTTAVSGLFYHIAPEGNMKKHLHFVISLCILVALAVPMFSMAMELPEIFEEGFEEVKAEENMTDEQLTEALIAVSKKEIETATVSYISEVYGISPADISVETVLNAEDPEAIEISRVLVILRDEDADAGTIQRALNDLFLGQSEVSVSILKP